MLSLLSRPHLKHALLPQVLGPDWEKGGSIADSGGDSIVIVAILLSGSNCRMNHRQALALIAVGCHVLEQLINALNVPEHLKRTEVVSV